MSDDSVKPFLKWVGGKRRLLPFIRPHLPETFGAYHEPFLGGAAMFFDLAPKKAFLSDDNERLVRTYVGIQKDVEGVIGILDGYRYERAFFEKMRSKAVDGKRDAEIAAWFIYLNRTGFNGLYRVNSRNVFNVPFGDYAKPRVCRPENLRAASAALKGATIGREDFRVVLDRAEKNDFVYFDPPYVPLTKSASFTAYTKGGFGEEQHEALRDAVETLTKRGVSVLVSNSSVPYVRKLYTGFDQIPIHARRSVSCDPTTRAGVEELLIVAKPKTARRRGKVSA